MIEGYDSKFTNYKLSTTFNCQAQTSESQKKNKTCFEVIVGELTCYHKHSFRISTKQLVCCSYCW